MGSGSVYWLANIFNILIQCKIEIITGVFSSLAIYSYFYDIKLKKSIDIMALKKKIKEINNINPENKEAMSDERINHLENILNRIEKAFEKRFDKIDSIQDKQNSKIDEIEDNIATLEKNNAVTRRELALYVTIGVFVLLQILEKINIF